MIIKSHVRGGYRAAAHYLKQIGSNEKIRLVEISDTNAKDLDEAFRNMWMVGKTTRAKKPLHHVSINPYKDEHLSDAQVRKICERLEEKYGYRPGDHQRVIVEHVKDGRQHFHVMWNRVSLRTSRPGLARPSLEQVEAGRARDGGGARTQETTTATGAVACRKPSAETDSTACTEHGSTPPVGP